MNSDNVRLTVLQQTALMEEVCALIKLREDMIEQMMRHAWLTPGLDAKRLLTLVSKLIVDALPVLAEGSSSPTFSEDRAHDFHVLRHLSAVTLIESLRTVQRRTYDN